MFFFEWLFFQMGWINSYTFFRHLKGPDDSINAFENCLYEKNNNPKIKI